jgi:hypothetical protein
MPLLFPNIPFGLFGAETTFLIASTDADGHPHFESWLFKRAGHGRVTLNMLRVLSWVLILNLCYWLFLCTPLIISRLLFGPTSMLVP